MKKNKINKMNEPHFRFIQKKVKELIFQLVLQKLKNKFKNVSVIYRTQSQLVLKSINKMKEVKDSIKSIPLSFTLQFSEAFKFNDEFFLVIKFKDPEDHQMRWISKPITDRELFYHKIIIEEYSCGAPENPYDRIYWRKEFEKTLKKFNLTLTDVYDSVRELN